MFCLLCFGGSEYKDKEYLCISPGTLYLGSRPGGHAVEDDRKNKAGRPVLALRTMKKGISRDLLNVIYPSLKRCIVSPY